jgi:hypothetical protein
MSVTNGTVVLIKSGSTVVGATRTLQLSFQRDKIKVSSKNDARFNRYRPGDASWTGSVGGVVDLADAGQTSLLTAIRNATDISVTIGKETPATGDFTYAGSVSINRYGESYQQNSESALDVSFQGKGPIAQTVTS